MGELLTGVDPVAAFVPFCMCQNGLAWAGFWCARSWESLEGFLSIPMRMGICGFSLCTSSLRCWQERAGAAG